jgi:hypothetical protein
VGGSDTGSDPSGGDVGGGDTGSDPSGSDVTSDGSSSLERVYLDRTILAKPATQAANTRDAVRSRQTNFTHDRSRGRDRGSTRGSSRVS